MLSRLGPGPVFVYEWITTSRRWQLYALRAGFVGLILLAMAITWSSAAGRGGAVSIRRLAEFGSSLFQTIASIELTLVLLAAPAATAGAVCLDKARGTLDHMLTTDLSDAEIVLGKLGVRLVPVLGLVACTLPVLALSILLGGIDPLALGGLILVAIGCALVGCSLAMVLSVYGRKTHEVVMLAYMILMLWIMAPIFVQIVRFTIQGPRAGPMAGNPWTDWLEWTNPFSLAFAPYSSPGRVGVWHYLGFLAVGLLLSGALAGLATARVRRVAVSQAGRPMSERRRWFPRLRRLPSLPRLPGPGLDGNPVAWREWHRMRPSRMMRVAWGLYAALGLLWVVLAAAAKNRGPMGVDGVGLMNTLQVMIGLLLLSVGASTSLAEERVRGSLDVLLSTTISTRTILAGKWWGGFRRVLNVAIWPAAATLPLAIHSRGWAHYVVLLVLVLVYGAAITSLGLLVATYVSRVGRAVALCVSIYVVGVIGWPILWSLVLGDGPDFIGMMLMVGDPPYGAMVLTMGVDDDSMRRMGGPPFRELIAGGYIWIVVYLAATVFLYLAAEASFDRCLGRIPDDGRPAGGRAVGRPGKSGAQVGQALLPDSSAVAVSGGKV
jgi:ABC-type transport system involved in multi-copper enzyme maturation permease subunit